MLQNVTKKLSQICKNGWVNLGYSYWMPHLSSYSHPLFYGIQIWPLPSFSPYEVLRFYKFATYLQGANLCKSIFSSSVTNNAASVCAGLYIVNKITLNQPSLRIPSYVKRNTVTINPVRAHATRQNSYPDLESSWQPPADPKSPRIKAESTHDRAKVCYFTKTRSWMNKISVTLFFPILSCCVRPQLLAPEVRSTCRN